MRACLLVTLLTASCTSVTSLPSTSDALRAGGHGEGFVVEGKRIDAGSVVQLRSRKGGWSPRLDAAVLSVNDAGVWLDGREPISTGVRAIRIVRPAADVARIIETTRPAPDPVDDVSPDADAVEVPPAPPVQPELTLDGDVWTLTADDIDLSMWIRSIATATAGMPAATLGTWEIVFANGGTSTFRGGQLEDMFANGVPRTLGWRWSEIEEIAVENLDGGKTMGAIVLTVAVAPVAILAAGFVGLLAGGTKGAASAMSLDHSRHHATHDGGGGGLSLRMSFGKAQPVTWDAEPAPPEAELRRPLFTPNARRRSVVEAIIGIDGAGARDHGQAGAFASLRLRDVLELGGGVRLRGDAEGSQTIGFGTLGLHLPLDARRRFAFGLGMELGKGGDVAHVFRLPLALRYAPSDAWFLFVQPFVPTHTRHTDEPSGGWRFEIAGGAGLAL